MDCAICPQTPAPHQSLPARPTERGGGGTGYARTLILIRSRLIPSLVFARGLGSKFWKQGTFSDLQQFVFNKRWQTTSSPPPQRHPPHSPDFYLCSAFEPGLEAAALKQTRPRGSLTSDRIASSSGIWSWQNSRVAAVRGRGGRCIPPPPFNHRPVLKSRFSFKSVCNVPISGRDARLPS